MATSCIDIDVHADEAWAVLSEPTTYPRWLVGSVLPRGDVPLSYYSSDCDVCDGPSSVLAGNFSLSNDANAKFDRFLPGETATRISAPLRPLASYAANAGVCAR